MQEPKDYYRILGLSEHASAEEVKQAYRTLARACHPDRNPDDVAAAEQFKGVQEAYEVLSDPQQRQHYDAVRHATASVFGHVRAQAFERSAFYNLDGQPVAGGHGHCYCGPLFDEAVPRPQQDVEVPVRLSFEQALRGGKVEIRLPDGRCARVAVPKGVRSGLKVRLKGKRRPGTEASQGDLYVTFHVAPSARFRRNGDHLHVTETITAVEAMLGTTRSITSAYGRVIKLPIPPGTQPGECFRLRGQGIVTAKRAGDLFVEIQVEVPKTLTAAQREQIRKAAQDAGLL